jgi:hypothetical protein
MFTRATQCERGTLDPPVSVFSLSLYRHPFLFTLCSSRFTLIINNNKSQSPDIPGASSRADFFRHTTSFRDQSKDPDIYSLRSYTEELLASLNAQAQSQAPDDPSQTLASDFHLLSLCAYMEELSAFCNAQGQAPDDLHAEDRQCAPCIFTTADQNLQGYPRRRTSHTFPFNKCHKTVHRISLIAYCHCPIRVVRGSRFMCVVYGFQLLVKVWCVFIVLVLDILLDFYGDYFQ